MRSAIPVLLGLLVITGCVKNNSNTNSQAAFSATVGSGSYQGTTTLAAFSYSLNELSIISYSQRTNDTTAFQIVMPWTPPVNKTFVSDSLFLSYTAKGTEYFAHSSGGQLQLIVTTIDSTGHKISGTFTATGHSSISYNDSVVITNGKFNTSYSVNP